MASKIQSFGRLAVPALFGAASLPALAGATLSNGVLLLTTDNEQQQIEIIVGPQPGRVQVVGIDGVPGSGVFTGVTLVDLRTGTNTDNIEFRMFGTVFPEVRVDTRSGLSDVKFIYDIRSANRVTTLVTVLGGPTHDKVAFEVINNDARNLVATWNVAHGQGGNETKAAVTSDDPTSSIDIDLNTINGAGIDRVTASVIHRAARLHLDVVGATGGSNDSAIITIDGLGPAITNLNVDLDLGGGNDVSEIIAVSRGGTSAIRGTIRGREGDDLLKLLLEGNGSVNTWLLGAGGDDYLDVELKGSIVGTPRLIAGYGQDFLKIVQESRQTTPLLDGGPGIDTGHGFGTFISVEDRD